MNNLQLLLIGAALAAGPVAADEITLRDGSTIDGTLVGASEQVLHLRIANGVRHVAIARVARIGFAHRSEAAARPSPTVDRGQALIVGSGSDLAIRRD